jgi:hypothetical protein
MLVGSGCGSETVSFEIGFSGFFFSPQLRQDLDGLSPAEEQDEAPIYHTADSGGLVSAMVPEGVPNGRLATLRRSEVLWTTGDIEVNYETVFFRPTGDGAPFPMSAGAYDPTLPDYDAGVPVANYMAVSERGATEPFSRRYLVWNDRPIRPEDLADGYDFQTIPIHTALEICRDGDALGDPFEPAAGLDRDCILRPANRHLCSGGQSIPSYLPWTVLGCSIQGLADATVRVRVIGPAGGSVTDDFPNAPEAPLFIGSIKRVDRPRVLTRSLRFQNERCLMRNGEDCDADHRASLRAAREECLPGGTVRVPGSFCYQPGPGIDEGLRFASLQGEWTYEVPANPDGTLLENFAPGVSLTKLKFKVPDGRGGLRYVQAEQLRRVRFDTIVERGSVRGRCPAETEPGTGHAVVLLSGCDFAGDVTPSWADGALDPAETPSRDARIRWSIGFISGASDDVPLLRRIDTVLVEVGIDAYGRPIYEPRSEPVGPATADGVLTRDLPAIQGDAAFVEFHVAP